MKSLLIALALVCSPALAQDTWTGPDKKLHFGVSFLLGVAAVNQWPDGKMKAFGVALIPGVLKELSDAQKGGTGFSGKDMVANAIGAGLGVYTGGWLISSTQGSVKVSYAATF